MKQNIKVKYVYVCLCLIQFLILLCICLYFVDGDENIRYCFLIDKNLGNILVICFFDREMKEYYKIVIKVIKF